jgi:hypothetical protein
LWVQVGVAAVVGAATLAAHIWPRVRSRIVWIATVITFVVVTANVVAASVLFKTYHWEFPKLHMLYEFSGIVAIGIMYSYAKQMKARQYLIYGFGDLFLMGLALRALFMS